MKIGRFVVDGHIHGSTKYLPKEEHEEEVAPMSKIWAPIEPEDNSDAIIFDMDIYGIDMGILKPSFTGTLNEMQAQMVDKYPTRFRAECSDLNLRLKCARGEVEWNIKDACDEIENVLTSEWGKGRFSGIGEFAPGGMGVIRKPPTYEQRQDEFRALAELAGKHDVALAFHEYELLTQDFPGGLFAGLQMITKVAIEYPSTRFVIMHGGGQYPEDIRHTVECVSMTENIWLETGYWKAEYYEIALKHPNFGAHRLIWGGGDTGSSLWSHFPTQPGNRYLNATGFWLQKRRPIPLPYQPDWYGWPTHQIHRLKDLDLVTQDEINLIVGGNAAKVFKLPVPRDRMFMCGVPDIWGVQWKQSIPWVPEEQVQRKD